MRTLCLTALSTLFLVGSLAAAATADERQTRRAESAIDASQGGTEVCGHLPDLEAARTALRNGDRGTALRHLKEARRLLTSCEQRVGIRDTPRPAGRPI